MFVCEIRRKARTWPRPELDRNIWNDVCLFDPTEIPLAAALSRMLEHIEAELANDKLDAPQEERLRWRAELIRKLLTLRPIPQLRERG